MALGILEGDTSPSSALYATEGSHRRLAFVSHLAMSFLYYDPDAP